MTASNAELLRLNRMIADLCAALLRQGTERDGNWGHPSTHAELQRIGAAADEAARMQEVAAASFLPRENYFTGPAPAPVTPTPGELPIMTRDEMARLGIEIPGPSRPVSEPATGSRSARNPAVDESASPILESENPFVPAPLPDAAQVPVMEACDCWPGCGCTMTCVGAAKAKFVASSSPAAPPAQVEGLTENEASTILGNFRHAHAGSFTPAVPESGLRECPTETYYYLAAVVLREAAQKNGQAKQFLEWLADHVADMPAPLVAEDWDTRPAAPVETVGVDGVVIYPETLKRWRRWLADAVCTAAFIEELDSCIRLRSGKDAGQ